MNTPTNYNDVLMFHKRFGLPTPTKPALLDKDTMDFRLKRLYEEMIELQTAVQVQSLAHTADALVDLVYIALGTAVQMGLPWQHLWTAVHAANMQKVRAAKPEDSRYGTTIDIVKPAGWEEPDIKGILQEYM